MEDKKLYTCCFFGHREISRSDSLKIKLYTAINELIQTGKVHTFLFGSKSKFDDLCYEVVSELKEIYPFINRIYVRAEYPYIDDNYRNYLLKKYDDTYYPEGIINAGKAVYVERNYEMVDKSSFCICYYDTNYIPTIKRNQRRTAKSGTGLAYDYAVKRGLKILNII